MTAMPPIPTLQIRYDMSSMNRPLADRALRFSLGDGSSLVDQDLLMRGGRTARTLVKEGALRVTLVALGSGSSLAPHHADGPITVHVLFGQMRFRAGDSSWSLAAGDLLSLPAGVEHAVESEVGATFLLTVAA